MEDDESLDPVDVSFLGPPAVVPHVNRLPHAIQQLRFSRLHDDDDGIVINDGARGVRDVSANERESDGRVDYR